MAATVVMRALATPAPPILTNFSGTLIPDGNGYVTADVRDMALLLQNSYAIGSPGCNFAATRDPGATDDQNEGYRPGSFWINASAYPRVWFCISAAPGAANWILLYERVQ